MAIASFQHLCAGFCEVVRVPAPSLWADADGRVAFHVIVRGATVNLVHLPSRYPEHVFVVFDLGRITDDGPASAARSSAMLEANFALLELYQPTFSRNPASGDVVLQYIYPLFDATPAGLYELIHQGVDIISRVRGFATAPFGSEPPQVATCPPVGALHQLA